MKISKLLLSTFIALTSITTAFADVSLDWVKKADTYIKLENRLHAMLLIMFM